MSAIHAVTGTDRSRRSAARTARHVIDYTRGKGSVSLASYQYRQEKDIDHHDYPHHPNEACAFFDLGGGRVVPTVPGTTARGGPDGQEAARLEGLPA
jgi:hypothetical protein